MRLAGCLKKLEKVFAKKDVNFKARLCSTTLMIHPTHPGPFSSCTSNRQPTIAPTPAWLATIEAQRKKLFLLLLLLEANAKLGRGDVNEVYANEIRKITNCFSRPKSRKNYNNKRRKLQMLLTMFTVSFRFLCQFMGEKNNVHSLRLTDSSNLKTKVAL